MGQKMHCAPKYIICVIYICVFMHIYNSCFCPEKLTEFNFINNGVLHFRKSFKTSSPGTETFPGLQAVSVFIIYPEILLSKIKSEFINIQFSGYHIFLEPHNHQTGRKIITDTPSPIYFILKHSFIFTSIFGEIGDWFIEFPLRHGHRLEKYSTSSLNVCFLSQHL